MTPDRKPSVSLPLDALIVLLLVGILVWIAIITVALAVIG